MVYPQSQIVLQIMEHGKGFNATFMANKVTGAWYGDPKHPFSLQHGTDVTSQVRQRISFQQELKADNSIFGDPCPNVKKALFIRAQCIDQLNLTEKSGIGLSIEQGKISTAWYGANGKIASAGLKITELVASN